MRTIASRGDLPVEPIATAESGPGAVEEIFADASRNKMNAARKALGYLQAEHQAEPLINAARRLIFLKGDDAHDYKFSSAVLEDVYALPPALRPAFMAASMFHFRGSGDSDNNLIRRARAALARA